MTKNGEDFYSSSYIVICVFNAFLCFTAIVFNSVTIHAIRKTSVLTKSLKTLLLSLAVSDIGVGLLVQPWFIALRIMELKQNPATENNPAYNTSYTAYVIPANLFSIASFFGVMALSTDRFLAIHLHLRHQELVTNKRVVAVVISIWLLSAFLSLITLWIPMNIILIIFAIIEAACVLTATFFSIKTYLTARGHINQIQALQVRQASEIGEMENVAKMRKFAIATFYLYLVFLVCYLPHTCILLYIEASAESSRVIKVLSRYLGTLLLLNSSLNPLIYCWKMKHIRHAVMDMLRNSWNMIRSEN